MATTIINPTPNTNPTNNGMAFLFGMILLIVCVALFIFYVVPYINGVSGDKGVQVNVPKTIDINVKQTK